MLLQQVRIDPSLNSDIVDAWSSAVERKFWPNSKGGRRRFYEQFQNIRVFFAAPNSIDSAIAASVADNYGLVAIAVIAICIFVVCVLVVRGRIFVRTTLGIMGLFSVGLSIGAGFGLSLFIGLPFTTVTQVLPFILLGVGVDDMFMLVQSLEEVDATSPGLPLEERFRRTLNRGGMSITVTSFTNAAAFLFGSITSIPAIQWYGTCLLCV
jgi:Niemann-Pick C1 protein